MLALVFGLLMVFQVSYLFSIRHFKKNSKWPYYPGIWVLWTHSGHKTHLCVHKTHPDKHMSCVVACPFIQIY